MNQAKEIKFQHAGNEEWLQFQLLWLFVSEKNSQYPVYLPVLFAYKSSDPKTPNKEKSRTGWLHYYILLNIYVFTQILIKPFQKNKIKEEENTLQLILWS